MKSLLEALTPLFLAVSLFEIIKAYPRPSIKVLVNETLLNDLLAKKAPLLFNKDL